MKLDKAKSNVEVKASPKVKVPHIGPRPRAISAAKAPVKAKDAKRKK